MKRILVIGATSAIAQATARLWAAQGHHLYLLARDPGRLAAVADDLRVRGAAHVDVAVLDVTSMNTHSAVVNKAVDSMGTVDIALIAHGVLPEQSRCEREPEAMLDTLHVNALSVMSLAGLLAERMEAQRSGVLAVLGSVAGDRGRKSNYVYGSAKAAVGTFLQGLRNRMHSIGVSVVTIKPGFVDTPMTAGFRKGPLWASAHQVASGIVRAVDRRVEVAYLPWFWGPMMLAIRLIPESIFKRMHL